MNHQPEQSSPKHRPDPTLVAMIVSTGLLIAWAYSAARNPVDLDLRSSIFPVIPTLLDGE